MSDNPEYCEHHMCIKAGEFVEVQECLRCRISVLEQQLDTLREAAQEVVEAERLNRSTTRNYRGIYATKKRPRHRRFEEAIERLAALEAGDG